jgi:hypothetical protein
MHILVFGTGGVGGFFGAQLANAGEDVIFIARGEHLKAIPTRGLLVEMPGGEIAISPAQATDDPAAVNGVDVVLLGVKAWQMQEAAKALAPAIGSNTFVVPLQNRVDAASQLCGILGSRMYWLACAGPLVGSLPPAASALLQASTTSNSGSSTIGGATALSNCKSRSEGLVCPSKSRQTYTERSGNTACSIERGADPSWDRALISGMDMREMSRRR